MNLLFAYGGKDHQVDWMINYQFAGYDYPNTFSAYRPSLIQSDGACGIYLLVDGGNNSQGIQLACYYPEGELAWEIRSLIPYPSGTVYNLFHFNWKRIKLDHCIELV